MWKPGQSGNPAGRKPGSRSKLSEAFLSALNADFEQHGTAVIAKVRLKKPDVYLKVIANLMPARLEALLEAQINVQHQFDDTNSIEDILQLVAKEAGMEAAQTLASMFGLGDRMQDVTPPEEQQFPYVTPPRQFPKLECYEDRCPHTGTTYQIEGGRRLPYRNCQCGQCREWRGDVDA